MGIFSRDGIVWGKGDLTQETVSKEKFSSVGFTWREKLDLPMLFDKRLEIKSKKTFWNLPLYTFGGENLLEKLSTVGGFLA